MSTKPWLPGSPTPKPRQTDRPGSPSGSLLTPKASAATTPTTPTATSTLPHPPPPRMTANDWAPPHGQKRHPVDPRHDRRPSQLRRHPHDRHLYHADGLWRRDPPARPTGQDTRGCHHAVRYGGPPSICGLAQPTRPRPRGPDIAAVSYTH